MAEAGPLDAQREARWPDHTPAGAIGAEGVKVKFNRYEVDSNASVTDDEDEFEGYYEDEDEPRQEGEGEQVEAEEGPVRGALT